MFFDIHAHVYKYPYPSGNSTLFMTEEQLYEHNRQYNIDQSVLLPIVSSEVYIPQSTGEIIDIANHSGGRFIPFCNLDPRVLTNSSDAPIGRLLEFYREQGCKGIGEVMPNLDWNDLRMQNLLHCVEQIGFPLLFDMNGSKDSGYGIYDEPGMPHFEDCLRKYPNLVFIGHGPAFWAEISKLKNPEDRHAYPHYPVFEEGKVATLLRTYRNLFVDLSAGSGANAMMRDKQYAIRFLNEFCDRVIFGTDTCYFGHPVPMVNFLTDQLTQGLLNAEVFIKIAEGNAKRLLGL